MSPFLLLALVSLAAPPAQSERQQPPPAPPSSQASAPAAPVRDAAVDWVVAEFDRRESLLARRGVVLQREREDLARQLAATLPLRALTPGQWAKLHDSPIFPLLDLREQALDALGPFLTRDDAQGAAAVVLHLFLRAEAGELAGAPAAERVDLLRRALTHPGLDEAVRKGWAPRLFLLLGLIAPREAPPLADTLFSLERLLTDDLPLTMRPDLHLLYQPLRELTVLDPARAEALERIRLRMLHLLREAMDALPPGKRWEAARATTLLESDWAKHAAFPAPPAADQPPEDR
ncbi:MAG: hypothetical protein D6824_07970 [Planctomycetota bacterium]|nr:MAG: hypothetical protein D6824_07970 [Planctomycetota bacterium]